jgi:AraC-like DNA-binding protein
VYYALDIQTDGAERVQYNNADMPLYARQGQLASFQNYAAACHWHDDVEFIVNLKGHMSYNVNGQIIVIGEGEGLFVNADQLHYGFSEDGSDCEFLCVLFSPRLLCVNLFAEQKLVAPIIRNNAFPYSIIQASSDWETKLLFDLKHLFTLINDGEPLSLIKASIYLYGIWAGLFENMPDISTQGIPTDKHLVSLRQMMEFVHIHYSEKITLPKIAEAGCVCQSNCCVIFNKYLHQTPIQYLTSYRLKMGARMLLENKLNITEIACSCGFGSSSFFAETFKKTYRCSPTKYLKNLTTK